MDEEEEKKIKFSDENLCTEQTLQLISLTPEPFFPYQ